MNWFILILLSMAQFMVVLDFSIVNVALPTIQQELHFSQANLQWIVTAYALTFGGLLLLGGGLADLYGRKRLFIVGLLLFSIVSFIGGISQSQIMLIIARGVQGIAAALIMPSSMALITSFYTEPHARQRALSILGAVGSSGFALGVLLGGLLTVTLGWRWVLFVNVPIGIITALLTYRFVPETIKQKAHIELDIPGTLTITLGLATFIFAITTGGEVGFTSPLVLLSLAISVILLGSFVFIELKSKNPLVPFHIFTLPSVRGANISMFLWMGAFGTVFLLLAQYLQDVLHYSALVTGFMFFPMGVVTFVMSSYFSSKLMDRFGTKPVIVSGFIIAAIGLLFLTSIPVDGTYLRNVLPGMLLIALGVGASFVGLLVASVAGVPPNQQGLASGLINTSRQIGASVGIAALVALGDAQTRAIHTTQAAAFTDGIHYAFLGGFVLAVISVLASIVFIKETECNAAVKKVDTSQRVANRVVCLQ